MANHVNALVNRRQLARSAMCGGASLLLGSEALAAPAAARARSSFVDVRTFGAVGDGKSDDTAALQRAIDAAAAAGGAVFVSPGIYLSGELHLRPGSALVGIPGWNYSEPGGSVLRLSGAEATCLLNLTDARGATLDGLALDGRGLGQKTHGIATNRAKWGEHEDNFRIERCQVLRFSGDGVHMACAWCFSVRHCMFGYNHGDGLSLRGWDGFILDNWFSGNKRAGFAAREENAAVTFTANRIEWNEEENVLIVGGNSYNITGNYFDRAGTFGLALRKHGQQACAQFSITGNYFSRSGKLASLESHDSGQILLDGAEGVTCIGNSMRAGRDDGGQGVFTPSYGIVYQGLTNCVIRDNVLHDGALRQLLLDMGSHGDGLVVGDNPGRLFTAKP